MLRPSNEPTSSGAIILPAGPTGLAVDGKTHRPAVAVHFSAEYIAGPGRSHREFLGGVVAKIHQRVRVFPWDELERAGLNLRAVLDSPMLFPSAQT